MTGFRFVLPLVVGLALGGCGTMTLEQFDQIMKSSANYQQQLQQQQMQQQQQRQQMQQQMGNGGGGPLKREIQDGFNRICVYDTLRGAEAITIPSTQMCPLWK